MHLPSSVSEHCSRDVLQAINDLIEFCSRQNVIGGPGVLVSCLLVSKTLCEHLEREHSFVVTNAIKGAYMDFVLENTEESGFVIISQELISLFENIAKNLPEQKVIDSITIFWAILKSDSSRAVAQFFSEKGLTIPANTFGTSKPKDQSATDTSSDEKSPLTSRKRSTQKVLDVFCDDLTALARDKKLLPVIGRENELRRIIINLGQAFMNSCVLTGLSGVGRNAIVEKLAQTIVSPECPPALKNAIVLRMNLNRIEGECQYPGDLDRHIESVLTAIEKLQGKVILYVRDLDRAVGEGKNASLISKLKPAILSGKARLIGTLSSTAWQKMKLGDPDLEKLFTEEKVNENTVTQTKAILTAFVPILGAIHKIEFVPETDAKTAFLADRYLEGQMPHKAIRLLDYAGAKANQKGQSSVSIDDLYDATQDLTGIGVSRLQEDQKITLLSLAKRIKAKVIGQDSAIGKICRAIQRRRAGFENPNNPTVVIVTGKTGVGKTLTAKTVALNLFDDTDALIRFDMAEFMFKEQAMRFTGPPPGYKESEAGSQLCEAVRRKPYSVILLDEFEKAHPDVYKVLLKVWDDGEMTDGLGRRASFKNTIFICTSNAETSGETEKAIAKFKELLPPELLNRVDEIIALRDLTKEDALLIMDLIIKEDSIKPAKENNNISITVDDTAKYLLVERGYDAELGARPLQRVVLKDLADPITEAFLANKINVGDEVAITAKEGAYFYSVNKGESLPLVCSESSS